MHLLAFSPIFSLLSTALNRVTDLRFGVRSDNSCGMNAAKYDNLLLCLRGTVRKKQTRKVLRSRSNHLQKSVIRLLSSLRVNSCDLQNWRNRFLHTVRCANKAMLSLDADFKHRRVSSLNNCQPSTACRSLESFPTFLKKLFFAATIV